MHVNRDELDVLEFVHRVLLDVILERARCRFGQTAEEWQFEHLGLRKTAGCIAEHRPHNVGHAVLGLIEQLGRFAAELHAGKCCTLMRPPLSFSTFCAQGTMAFEE